MILEEEKQRQWDDGDFKADRVFARCVGCGLLFIFDKRHPREVQLDCIDCACGTKALPDPVYWEHQTELSSILKGGMP